MGITVLCIGVVHAGCERDAPPPPATVVPSPPQEKLSGFVQTVNVGPLALFDQACANCHGANGSFYGPEFGKSLTREQLEAKVRQMIAGPARRQVDNASVLAMAAYHRSLILHEPFLAVTTYDGATLAGEVTPGCDVEVFTGGRAVPAQVKGFAFRVTLAEVDTGLEIVARLPSDSKEVRLKPFERAHTHAE